MPPLDLSRVIENIILPTYARVLPGMFNSREATVLLLAIGLQESRFEHRRQINGPACGYWQFERAGVSGVFGHQATARYAHAVCMLRSVAAATITVQPALETDDLLACAFARLLLYSDPAPLPAIGDVDSALDYYLRNWRPGKPHPETWPALYKRAVDAAQ